MSNNTFRSKKEITDKMPTRFYSSRQESQIAEAVNGKTTKNSGATMWQKGDITTDNWLLEAKTCTKSQKQFTLKEEWFEKNKHESLFMGKQYSAVVFNFGPDKPNYYIIDELTFQEFLNYLKESQ